MPPAPIAPALQAASVEPKKQFETNSLDTGDIGDAEIQLALLKSNQVNEVKSANKITQTEADAKWKDEYQLFNYALESLYRISSTEATKRGDGISKTVGYFQSLPPNLSIEIVVTNVAEIGFQKKTNVDFTIEVTGRDSHQRRGLLINCSSGFVMFYPNWNGQWVRQIHIPDFDDTKPIPDDKIHEFIDDGFKVLIASQIVNSSATNR